MTVNEQRMWGLTMAVSRSIAAGRIFRLRATVRAGLLCASLTCPLLGCGFDPTDPLNTHPQDSDTTSGHPGPFLETSRIVLEATPYHLSPEGEKPAKSGLLIAIREAQTLARVRIGDGDSLKILLGDTPLPLHSYREIQCEGKARGPCFYVYSYKVLYDSDDAAGKTITFAFEREAGTDALQTIGTFPPKPELLSPSPENTLDLSEDVVTISWVHGEEDDQTRMWFNGNCAVFHDKIYPNTQTEETFPANTFPFELTSCLDPAHPLMQLRTSRTRRYPVDPAFAPSSVLEIATYDDLYIPIQP